MFGKYTASQLAKSTAAFLTALATFLGSVALIITGIAPDGWGFALAGVSAVITRYAVYLTNAEPTIAQVEKHIDEVIELVKAVRPGVIAGGTDPHLA